MSRSTFPFAWLLIAFVFVANVSPFETAPFCSAVAAADADVETWTISQDAPSWARTADGFAVSTESPETLGAKNPTIKIEHAAQTDWAVRLPETIAVEFGQIFELTARVKVEGAGSASTGVVLYSGDEALSWIFGGRNVAASETVQTVSSKFIVPRGVDKIEPRMTGDGAATVRFADYTIRRVGSIAVANDEARTIVCENDRVKLEAETFNGSFSLLDKRSGRLWKPIVGTNALFVEKAEETPNGFAFELVDGRTFGKFRATVSLEADAPEALVELSAPSDAPLTDSVAYPYAFSTKTTERVVLPVNEGISFPTTEPEPIVQWIHTFGGHGLCMAFWGVVDDKIGDVGGAALAGIVETPDDAAIDMRPRAADSDADSNVAASQKTLSIEQHWLGQKKKFGYARRLRLVAFDRGGYVAVCKRYRRYADEIGLLVSFDEKERRNPKLANGFERLIGAANVWCWEKNPLEIVDALKEAGIDRILWSAGGTAENLAAMNEIDGVLTSRYDIYQDTMNPARFPELNGVHSDWTSDGWPHDLVWDSPDGHWTRGWEVEAKDPSKPRIPCGVLCDSKALPYAEKRIADELKTKPYRARFLDTTTASSWRECWNPDHPMTRTDSKVWRMKLLELTGSRFDLVCGSETGIDSSVPFCDFYEGMESLGPYRCPESGRDMARIWTEIPDVVRKYQVGEEFRLPLFELVYHECVVSYWYWGDYNNKFPEIWKKRDLFNALYGVPPMYMFSREFFDENRERFAESYRIAEPVSRLTGRSEMIDHQILTSDRTVQKSVFANGVEVCVNFGDETFKDENGVEVAPKSMKIVGAPEN